MSDCVYIMHIIYIGQEMLQRINFVNWTPTQTVYISGSMVVLPMLGCCIYLTKRNIAAASE